MTYSAFLDRKMKMYRRRKLIPFYTDRSEAPLVRAGTGFHIAISAMGALVLAVFALVTAAGILIFLYIMFSGGSLL
ncbi:MAG: hypothetical protein CMI26_07295 [Opitutae bacterium]|mgnify:CR=1 FL=1|nr:hypothetical protein [Opitutae bacterium]